MRGGTRNVDSKIVQLPYTRSTWRQLARQASDLTAELTAIGHERRKLDEAEHATTLELQQVWRAMSGWADEPRAA